MKYIFTSMKNREMKQIVDLMDKSITKLNKLIEANHFMKCNNCGIPFDMRKLDEVIKHEMCINYN